MQKLKEQVFNITEYSQQKSSNPKSLGKKSRRIAPNWCGGHLICGQRRCSAD